MSLPVNLPDSKEAYLMFRLENDKFTEIVSALRWVHCRSDPASKSKIVNSQIAEWIEKNWSWLIKEYKFTDTGKLVMTFSVTGVTIADTWSIEKDTNNKQEHSLYCFAEKQHGL